MKSCHVQRLHILRTIRLPHVSLDKMKAFEIKIFFFSKSQFNQHDGQNVFSCNASNSLYFNSSKTNPSITSQHSEVLYQLFIDRRLHKSLLTLSLELSFLRSQCFVGYHTTVKAASTQKLLGIFSAFDIPLFSFFQLCHYAEAYRVHGNHLKLLQTKILCEK